MVNTEVWFQLALRAGQYNCEDLWMMKRQQIEEGQLHPFLNFWYFELLVSRAP